MTPPQTKTFRIFVSSTFNDFIMERDALQERVFPELQALCTANHCLFQAIDLRWGVSGEAALDQQTMPICLSELRRCKEISPRPNFILLLGDRYGWIPLPPRVEAAEFAELTAGIPAAENRLLQEWYLLDRNAVPEEYTLRPRRGDVFVEQDYDAWSATEKRIRAIFLEAIARQNWAVADERRIKYECSATHQEIIQGALRDAPAGEHAFAFLRTIRNLEELSPGHPFCDEEYGKAQALKEAIQQSQGVTAFAYDLNHRPGEVEPYIERFAHDALAVLSRIIEEELRQLKQVNAVDRENRAHDHFAAGRREHFIGRSGILHEIAAYLQDGVPAPLVLHGPSGSGKSALLAQAAELARRASPLAQVIQRFISATPESIAIRSLLDNLCQDISWRFGLERAQEQKPADQPAANEGREASDTPEEPAELMARFRSLLGMIPADRRLLLFIDALDQLCPADNAHMLQWLPAALPENVRIVVSVMDREDEPEVCLRVARAKFPEANLIPLGEMTRKEAAKTLRVWLAAAGRTLTERQFQVLEEGFGGCPRPLYLRLAFEEARHWTSADAVPGNLEGAPGLAADIPGLIRNHVARLQDRRNHGEVIVKALLGLLCASRKGLTEQELLELLSKDREVMADLKLRSARSPEAKGLPVVVWLRLCHDLASLLMEFAADRTVLLGFYHRQIEEILREGYGDRRYHSVLADYFAEKPLWIDGGLAVRIPNYRKCSELPYQQAKADSRPGVMPAGRLALADLRFIEAKSAAEMIPSLLDDFNLTLAGMNLAGADLDALNSCARFVRACSHRLARRPDLTLQEAMDFAMVPAVHQQARDLLERSGRAWFRRLHYPAGDAACARCFQTLEVPSCSSLALSPDLNYLAFTVSAADYQSATVRIHDLGTGISRDLLTADQVTVHAIRGGGTRLVLLDGQRCIRVFDPSLGTECWPALELAGEIGALAVSPDGMQAIVYHAAGELSAWALPNHQRLWTRNQQPAIRHLAYSPDGRLIALAAAEEEALGHVEVLAAQDGESRAFFAVQETAAFRVQISADSRHLACWCQDGALRICDIGSGFCVSSFACDLTADTVLDASVDARYTLAVDTDRDCAVVLDRLSGARPLRLAGHTGTIRHALLSADGTFAVTAAYDGTVKLWHLLQDDLPQEAESHRYGVNSILVTPDGRVVSAADDLKVWSLSPSPPRSLERQEGHTRLLVTAPDGRHVLWNIPVTWTLSARQIRVMDIESGRCERVLAGHTDAVESIAFLPDGRLVLSGSSDGTARLWNPAEGSCAGVFPAGKRVHLSPDGRCFASIRPGVGLQVRSLPKGDLNWSDAQVQEAEIAVAPDAEHLVIGCESWIEMRSLKDGVSIWRSGPGLGCGRSQLAISPDARFVLVKGIDQPVRVLAFDTGRHLYDIARSETCRALSLLPDGRHVAGLTDHAVQLWNLASGCETACYLLFDSAWSCAVSPDGRYIAAGSDSGHVYILCLEANSMDPLPVTAWRSDPNRLRIGKPSHAIGCPVCREWSEVDANSLGHSCRCPHCGASLQCNRFALHGDWRPVAAAWQSAAGRMRGLASGQRAVAGIEAVRQSTAFGKWMEEGTAHDWRDDSGGAGEWLGTLADRCIGRGACLNRLDALAAGDKPLVLILGEEGIGKSTLLARWVREHSKAHPDHLLFSHFVGDERHGAGIQEFTRRLDALMETMTAGDQVYSAPCSQVIILIDGFNLIEESSLPALMELVQGDWPAAMHWILALSPGRLLTALAAQPHAELVVRGLEEHERGAVLQLHLAERAVQLSKDRIVSVIQTSQAANPLNLVLLSCLLARENKSDTRDSVLNRWLDAESPARGFELLLESWERDPDLGGKALVRRLLCALWSAEGGLSSDELCELAGLSPASWLQLCPVLAEWTRQGSATVAIAYDSLREAIRLRYLQTDDARRACWRALARCLGDRAKTPRRVRERLRALELAGEWEELASGLTDEEVFYIGWNGDKEAYLRHWQAACRHQRFRLERVMNIAVEPRNLRNLLELLDELGQLALSWQFKKQLVEMCRDARSEGELLRALHVFADASLTLKKGDVVIAAAEEQERLGRRLGEPRAVLDALTRQADGWRLQGDLGRAEALYERVIAQSEAAETSDACAHALAGLGLIRLQQGQLEQARTRLDAADEFYRNAGHHRDLVECLHYRARICSMAGEIDQAIQLLEEQERIASDIGFKPGVYAALGNLATMLDLKLSSSRASGLRKRAEKLKKEIESESEAFRLIA